MRLPARQLTVIRDLARKHFGESAIVYLFGSRVDDARRGGDIDLFIDVPDIVRDRSAQVARYAAQLQRSLGEQRIDIIVRDGSTHPLPIHEMARRTGVRL